MQPPPDRPVTAPDNLAVAGQLREMAALLEAQGEDNPYRIAAYRRAADTLAELPSNVRDIFERDGQAGLDALPTIGAGIASAIAEILQSGHWARLERLRGAADPEALSRAAHAQPPGQGPPVELLLDVDRRYRAAAEQGRLPTIAPHRFNPEGKSWLPVLHTHRGGWAITALFSNTARAHELGRVRDWVVLYAEDESHREHQYTVVTATRGTLAGLRVVRGREDECRVLYRQSRTDVGGD